VKRIFELFHRELRGVHQAALLLALATIGSNLLGLVRDRFLASTFGAGSTLDMYYAAFRIPDLLYAVSLFFAASTAIIPVLYEKLNDDDRDAKLLMNGLFTVFLLVMSGILFCAFLLTPYIVRFMLPGFDGASIAEVTRLSRILLLSPLLLGLSNLVSSVIQSYKRFFIYALSPICYNLGIIVGVVFFAPRFGLVGLVWGVVLGAFAHFLIQMPSLYALGFMPKIVFRFPRDISYILKLSLPRTLGLAANQLTFIAATSVASLVGAGSIAVFNLSYNLQSIPLAVIGLSYSVAAFPTMAELIVRNEKKVFFEHLTAAARHIVFWTLPMSVLFIVLRAQIVRTILGAGRFDWGDTRLTAASLALFSLGIVAQSLSLLFIRAFYAVGKTKIPVLLAVLSSVVTIGASLVFVQVLQSSGEAARVFSELLRVPEVPRLAVLGLPLAFALGSIIQVVLLASSFGRVEEEFRNHGITRSAWDIVVSSFLLGLVSYHALSVFDKLFDTNHSLGIFLQGFCAGLVGIVCASIFLYVRKNQEFLDVWQAAHQRFWRSAAPIPEPEHLP
jgi:putative peptidoglycan lipid II flippase